MLPFVAAFGAARFATPGLVLEMLAEEPRLLVCVPQELLPAVNANEPLVRETHNDCASLLPFESRRGTRKYTASTT